MVLSGKGNSRLSSVGKTNRIKTGGVPPWNEQLAEFGVTLWRDLPNRTEEVLAALVLLLAFSVFVATL